MYRESMEMLGCKGLMCYTGLILQGEVMWISIGFPDTDIDPVM